MNVMLVCLAMDVFIGILDMIGHKKIKGIHCKGAQIILQSNWFKQRDSNLFKKCKDYVWSAR
jgi:hypothetical protein